MKRIVVFLSILVVLTGCMISGSALLQEPRHNGHQIYIRHFAYSLVFNPRHKQADWVAYKLSSYQLQKNFKRTNRFVVDTMVPVGTATNADYYKSGYDKGHLAPASDMTWNKQAMRESFYFSNISPQLPGFNRGIWKKLETKVRHWAMLYDSVYVCTGPVFTDSVKYIGENRIMVPTHFFKTVLVYNDTIKQAIGFIFPHCKGKNDIFGYVVTVDSVERLTDLDIYSALPNLQEDRIESSFDLEYWTN